MIAFLISSIIKVYIFNLLIDLKISDSLINRLVVWRVPNINSLVLCVYLNFILFKGFPNKADLGLFFLEFLLSLEQLCFEVANFLFVFAHSFPFFLALVKVVLGVFGFFNFCFLDDVFELFVLLFFEHGVILLYFFGLRLAIVLSGLPRGSILGKVLLLCVVAHGDVLHPDALEFVLVLLHLTKSLLLFFLKHSVARTHSVSIDFRLDYVLLD